MILFLFLCDCLPLLIQVLATGYLDENKKKCNIGKLCLIRIYVEVGLLYKYGIHPESY